MIIADGPAVRRHPYTDDVIGGRGRFGNSVVGSMRFGLGFPIFVFCCGTVKGCSGDIGGRRKK